MSARPTKDARERVKVSARLIARAIGRGASAVKGHLHVLYHIVIVVLSAAIAASLPLTLSFVAERLLRYWSFIENEQVFLVSVEVAVALLLIMAFSHARTNCGNRKMSKIARAAGMVHFVPRRGVLARWTSRRSKERQAFMKDIMAIGSTGFRTFVDPRGDLHTAIQDCRAAKIMLVNPESPGAIDRARTIPDPEVTQESLRSQVGQTIAFLGALRAARKNVRLKLYSDLPLWKLAILGDHAWVQHYHPGLNVQAMPEYVFMHSQDPASLFSAFYQHFVMRWNDPSIPEYDLLSGELVYRDAGGNELRRDKLDWTLEDVAV